MGECPFALDIVPWQRLCFSVLMSTSNCVSKPEKFVSYFRVSTGQQFQSELGLEAQREAVSRFLAGHQHELVIVRDTPFVHLHDVNRMPLVLYEYAFVGPIRPYHRVHLPSQ